MAGLILNPRGGEAEAGVPESSVPKDEVEDEDEDENEDEDEDEERLLV